MSGSPGAVTGDAQRARDTERLNRGRTQTFRKQLLVTGGVIDLVVELGLGAFDNVPEPRCMTDKDQRCENPHWDDGFWKENDGFGKESNLRGKEIN